MPRGQSMNSERRPPGKSGKARIVSVGGDPIAARLYRQGGEPCVLGEIACCLRSAAEIFEYQPVSGAGRRNSCVRLFQQDSAKRKRVGLRTRARKNARVGADSHDAREHLWCDPVCGGAVDHGLEPLFVFLVVLGVRSKRVDQDVDVREDQSRSSMRSNRLALSLRSTPGSVPPPAWHSGSETGRRSARFRGRRSTSSRPCSMSEVRVVLRLAASSRARASRASSKRTVVLMCQSIRIICQYVNDGIGCPMGVLRRYSIPLTHRTGNARDAAHLAPLCSAPSRSRSGRSVFSNRRVLRTSGRVGAETSTNSHRVCSTDRAGPIMSSRVTPSVAPPIALSYLSTVRRQCAFQLVGS